MNLNQEYRDFRVQEGYKREVISTINDLYTNITKEFIMVYGNKTLSNEKIINNHINIPI